MMDRGTKIAILAIIGAIILWSMSDSRITCRGPEEKHSIEIKHKD